MRTLFLSGFLTVLATQMICAQNTTVDGARQYQTIRGLGVNANPQSWHINPRAVRSVLDQLINEMGCTSFRLMYDDCDWEAVNDNADPHVYNWKYFDSVYSSPRFQEVWSTVRYLNSKGITDITLSPDGASPVWMGGTTLTPGKEEEYAEMVASMVYYGRKRLSPAVEFHFLSPVNETTCGGNEGAKMTPQQFDLLYSAVATHLTKDGLTDVSIVGPDDCGGWLSNFQAMVNNPNTMTKVAYFGAHEYGSTVQTGQGLLDAVKSSPHPEKEVIMTEINAVCENCDGGVYNKDYGYTAYAAPAYKDILQHLNAGITAIQLWEAYDSRYHHPNRTLTWSMWGVFAINDTLRPDVYTRRTHFYTLEQLFKFVKPGYKRVDISTRLPAMTLSAYTDPVSGRIVITGISENADEQRLEVVLKGLGATTGMKYYFTDAMHNFVQGPDAAVDKHSFSMLIPPHCIFTLVSK